MPAWLVVMVVFDPVAVFTAVMTAPTMCAFEGSVTVPETEASVCAKARTEASKRAGTTTQTWRIVTPPEQTPSARRSTDRTVENIPIPRNCQEFLPFGSRENLPTGR